ncbi:hypothetical protein SLEP1_g51633 [Rubroshorea leprosula]|uniref:Uncharacterized protein n=1 Tax=Rubroshorea leprosula TaxID=152421 RepID=A0AAV5M3T1_9ROSI|nr:hypothetical protein SLEP1_g51633 [Rubroshorea leprosula]
MLLVGSFIKQRLLLMGQQRKVKMRLNQSQYSLI